MFRTALRWKRNEGASNALFRSAINRIQQQNSLSTESGRLEGKVALITGAASGLGKESAKEFVKQGAKVIIADIQDELGQSTAVDLGPNASFVHCDVTDETHVADAIDLAVARHGRLDIMYNNAGVAGTLALSISQLDIAGFDRTMAVNVRSMVAGIKHAARVMVPCRTGCIICTASVTGILGGIGPFDYSITKAAVIGLVKAAAAELGNHGIRVNCISPYSIPTPMGMNAMKEILAGVDVENLVEVIRNTGELEGVRCEAADVAKAAVYLASDEAKYVSGHNLVVDGGFTAIKRMQAVVDFLENIFRTKDI